MTMKPVLTFMLLVVAWRPISAQDPALVEFNGKLAEFAKQNTAIMENLEYLSDRIGARLTGSASMKLANEWVAAKMREYGLDNVHLESWSIPVAWERGPIEAHVVEPARHRLHMQLMAWTPGTRGTVSGPVVHLDAKPDNSDLDKYAGKLKNAWILMAAPTNVNHHPSRAREGDIWGRRVGGTLEAHDHDHAAEDQQRQNVRDDFLQKEGIAGVLIDSGKPQGLVMMTGSWRADGKQPPFSRYFVANESYQLLWRLVKREVPVTVRVKADAKWTRGPVEVYNTVGEIRGSEKPDEVVICGAHLDSWELGSGTVDNGTGSMVVLEAARLLKAMGVRPKRTIRFILFSGEEQGLFGSKEYVKLHKDEMKGISAVFVYDTGTGRITGIGTHGNPQVKAVLEKEIPALKTHGVERYSDFLMSGTDHASFYPERVPAFWFMQDPADYFLSHHTPTDTFDKALKDDLIQGATVMAICAYNVAQLPEMLPRRSESGGG